MQTNPRLLVIGPDDRLGPEVEQALSSWGDARVLVHQVPDFRQGLESARNRRPDLVLVEVSKQFRQLKPLVAELTLVSPESVIATVSHPDAFSADYSENDLLLESLRLGVRDCLRRPLSTADLTHMLERIFKQRVGPTGPLGRVVTFVSNKGGVGKSTLTVNVATGLAVRQKQPVLLIDASVQMGVCASLLDLQPKTTLTDACRELSRLDATLLKQLTVSHSSGIDLLAAPRNAVEAAEVDDEAMTRILTLARRTYPFVFVDTFPMLDRVMMAVLDLCDRAYIVAESTVPTVLGIASFLEVLQGLGLAREQQKLVLNRYANFAGNLKPEQVAGRLGRELDYVIAYEQNVLVAANVGTPYILTASRWFSRFRKQLTKLIDELAQLPGRASTDSSREEPA